MATHALVDDEVSSPLAVRGQKRGEEPIPLTRQSRLPSIVSIVETVQSLKEVYRPPSAEERTLLESWPGWGPYWHAFEPEPTGPWLPVGAQLRELLGAEGYAAASAATPTSYFTSPYISRAIWSLAEQLGFTGGHVLEPGCGTGQILSYAPPSLDLQQVTGVEQEPVTASIAQLLHPQAQIINSPLQEVAFADNAFDLVVGNVPFADVPIYDRTLPFKKKLSLHNYFLYRALSALRPGGLAILVTSRYTLDAATTWARECLSTLGVFLGAIRLPSHGHRWARTAVITDIVVFQRGHPTTTWQGHEWMEPAQLSVGDVQIPINTYFVEHPQQIVGTPSLGRGEHHDQELLITAPDDLEGTLEDAIGRLTLQAAQHGCAYLPRTDRTQLPDHLVQMRGDGLKEGCYYLLADHGLVQIVDGEAKTVSKLVAELTALVRVRDAALALLEAERDHTQTDEELTPLRHELNQCYDAYVAQYGPIRRSTLVTQIDKATGEERISRRLPPAMYAFRKDEHYPLVLGLETYDDETQQAEKAAIFSRRVNSPPVYKETAESREEAIALSLDRYGRLDFPFIAKATGRRVDQVAAYLGELVYEDPEEHTWIIAPVYLSGNVRSKLEVAQQALRGDTKWLRNVDALEKVQPEPIAPEGIKVQLGAPWVPVEYIVQFCHDLLKLTPEIARDHLSGSWDVAPPAGVSYSVEATSTWGTSRVHAFRLVEQLLNHRTTVVQDEDAEGKMRVNSEETMLALQKRKELQLRFGEWIWEDRERTHVLAALFNRLYNGMVPSTYTGDHLTFPGMDAFWQQHLYSWQRDFLARMITNPSGLCAYPVGAGKTKIQVAGAMTLRRMQLISKAAILVPNHLLEQIAAEAKQLYPGANILMISRADLSRENRRIFMARIATGDHDLVVMTHSAFEAIDVHPDTKIEHIRQRIKEYRQLLYAMDPDSENRADQRRIKRIENLLARMYERVSELLDAPHDAGITWEMLNISYLIVDEAHMHKNLGLPTNQEKLQVQPSQRAQDMLMKLRWLERNNGKRPFASFFTATPISNSMVEAFVMLWYLNVGLLQAYGLYNVDDFNSMFIETEAKIEVSPNGVGFRMYERPRKFVNLPEFMHLFARVVDIRSPDILTDKRPDSLEHTVAVEPTPEVVAFVNWLVQRSEALHRGSPLLINGKEDNWLWLTSDGRMAALWLGLHGIREEYPAKLDAIATEMAKVYHRWQENAAYLSGPYKSLQIGFCDMGTPSKEKGDQVYGVLRQLLVQKGVPAAGIRFIHEANSDSAKATLFEQCRSGEVAILLGSTAKLGTGTNIQTRCAAIHHCDAPWRTDELEQRTGRGQRPGNLYPVVEIFYYVQRRTFDAYSWQILTNKAKFFNQLRSMTGEISREMDYSEDSELTYGQVKAAATGDVLLLEHANVSIAADAFSRLHTSFQRARERDRQEAHYQGLEADRMQGVVERYQHIAERVAQDRGDDYPFMTPHRVGLAKKEDRRDHITREVLAAVVNHETARRIGTWKGVPIFFKVNLNAQTPYVLAINDPYRGCDVPCFAQWLEPDNYWRFDWRLGQFFDGLDATIEEQCRMVANKRQKAQEFEAQARTPFPQHAPWQAAITRKQALDDYIAFAATATSEQDLQQLAEMRQKLLDTVPEGLIERPKPKNTATFVLPPRNPNAEAAGEQPAERIVVVTTAAQEPTIAQVAREIQQRVTTVDPWEEPIVVADAAIDPWAALRQQYGNPVRGKRRRT